MKILLTGATGFLGFRTLEKLAEMDEVRSIIATGRTIKSSHYLKHPKITYILGELTDKAFVASITQDVEYVIHAAALSSTWGKYKEFEDSNLHSQINLINAIQKNKILKYIYISTPSIYFDCTNRRDISEDDPLPRKFINAYAATKRMAEIELVNSGIPYVILRPRALTGRGDTVIMPRLITAYKKGKLKIIGNGRNIVDLTSVSNAVDAIILGLKAEGRALNQIYNITNGEAVNLWEKITYVLSLMNERLPQKKIPYWLVLSIAQIMEWKSKLTNMKEPVLTKYGVRVLAKSMTLDISKARELLGYNPTVTTDESISEFINWYTEYEKNQTLP
jgi:nucleoside-diphosphate-sugar epimerase